MCATVLVHIFVSQSLWMYAYCILSLQVDQNLYPSAKCCLVRDYTVPLETVRHWSRQHVGYRQWLVLYIKFTW